MKDLKFEQKSSLSRIEAAELLEALAAAFREGDEAELPLGPGVLSLRVPEEFRSEVEFEVGDGEIELEIELKWPTGGGSKAKEKPKDEPDAEPEGEAGDKPESTPEPRAEPKAEPKVTARTEPKTKPKAKPKTASSAPAPRGRKSAAPAKSGGAAAKRT
ncbi:amphi-Trp domain-containing protein [Streptomyces sp. LMG1-1-1.1]|uniref:amphi-Trp domain-containing protein n=1 Tax=Streptomyces sp. LMG1-1-1.1 TaxID=3135245 RepID=UPI003467070E